MKKILLSTLLIATTYAQADWSDAPKYSYDYRSGNSYATTYSGDTADVRGYNSNTGSRWSTTIESDGDMTGTDSHYNRWSYDSGTKTYINYGTGKTCTGEGYARTCF